MRKPKLGTCVEIALTVLVIVGVVGLVFSLTGCTAEQRGWAHDNIPVLGALFTPFVPPPAIPWYNALITWVANQFAAYPVETTAVVGGATALGKQYLTKAGLPGTKKNADHKKAKQKDAEVSKKLDLLEASKPT